MIPPSTLDSFSFSLIIIDIYNFVLYIYIVFRVYKVLPYLFNRQWQRVRFLWKILHLIWLAKWVCERMQGWYNLPFFADTETSSGITKKLSLHSQVSGVEFDPSPSDSKFNDIWLDISCANLIQKNSTYTNLIQKNPRLASCKMPSRKVFSSEILFISFRASFSFAIILSTYCPESHIPTQLFQVQCPRCLSQSQEDYHGVDIAMA